MSLPETEVLTNLVARVFHVDDVTLGDPKQFLVKYRDNCSAKTLSPRTIN